MLDRSVEFWGAVIGGAIYVWLNAKEKPMRYRILMVSSSGLMAFSLAPALAELFGLSLVVVGALIVTLAYAVIDLLTAIVADRALMLGFIKKWWPK